MKATSVEKARLAASASTVPIRSPNRPITATWIEPAKPATSASVAVIGVRSAHVAKLYARAFRARRGAWFERWSCTRASLRRSGTSGTSTSSCGRSPCNAFRHGQVRSDRRSASRLRVLRGVRVGRRATLQGRHKVGRVRCDRQGRDGDGHPLHRRVRRDIALSPPSLAHSRLRSSGSNGSSTRRRRHGRP